MSIANLIRRMTEAGAPPEAIAIAVEEIEAIQACLDSRREADKLRKRAQRERQKTEDVTGQSEDSPETVTPMVSLDKKVSQTLPKIKPIRVPPIIPQTWNEMAAKNGLPQVQTITGKRERAAMARIAEHGLDAVLRTISAVPTSPHWCGANGWLGNFDSLMRPENFLRMMEGAYAPAEPKRLNGAKPGEPVPLWKHLREQSQAAGATR